MNRTDAAGSRPLPAPWSFVVRVGSGIRWYVTSLMGDRAYDVYVAHQRAQHPGDAVMTERAFWRERMDEQDRNPGARCC